jgi:hypothetical protein
LLSYVGSILGRQKPRRNHISSANILRKRVTRFAHWGKVVQRDGMKKPERGTDKRILYEE